MVISVEALCRNGLRCSPVTGCHGNLMAKWCVGSFSWWECGMFILFSVSSDMCIFALNGVVDMSL